MLIDQSGANRLKRAAPILFACLLGFLIGRIWSSEQTPDTPMVVVTPPGRQPLKLVVYRIGERDLGNSVNARPHNSWIVRVGSERYHAHEDD